MPWIRAFAFGVVSVGVGIAGHSVASSDPANLRTLVLAMLLAVILARLVAHRRHAARELLVALGGFQLAIHGAATLVGTSGHAHANEAAAMNGWAMLAAHLVALLLGAGILLALESEAWALVRDGVTELGRVLRRLVARARRTTSRSTLSRPVVSAHWLPTPTQRRPGRGTRGPPTVVCLPA
ncbi:MAG: hypothetical protein JWM25_1005 [Thermoleophilia bacterium]|nr:hypothetical protein [Thermoleophilia bacterium]